MSNALSTTDKAADVVSGQKQQLAAARALLSVHHAGEAQALIAQELSRQPCHHEWLELAAVADMMTGQFAEAETHWRTLIQVSPELLFPYHHLEILLGKRRAEAELESVYRDALTRMQQNGAPREHLANIQRLYAFWLRGRERNEEAMSVLSAALEAQPEEPRNLCLLGILKADAREYEEAWQAYSTALYHKPDFVDALFHRALLANDLGDHGASEQDYRRALGLQPENSVTLNNLGLLLQNQMRFAEAEACFQSALGAAPSDLNTNVHYALLLLQTGRYREAWRRYEARLSPQRTVFKIKTPAFGFPRWHGEPLAGKSILIWPEQGFGDNIQFARLIPLLKTRMGAGRVSVRCRRSLMRLFQTLEGVDEVYLHERFNQPPITEIPAHDYWEFFLSLPLRLDITLDNLPATMPYLHVRTQPAWMSSWTKTRPPRRFRVGLAWRGNVHKRLSNKTRTVHDVHELAALWSVPDTDFYSLQKGKGEAETLNPPPEQPFQPLGGPIDDFADTAAIIERLDLVICIDTAVAHLANALGAPCWVLLPLEGADWRWGMPGSAYSPWYPRARLFRHRATGDQSWSPLIASVSDALASQVSRWREAN